MKSDPEIDEADRARITRITARLVRLNLINRATRICAAHDVPLDLALSRNRHKTIVGARKALYLWLDGLGYSFPQIGGILDVDHTTVKSGVGGVKGKPRLRAPIVVVASACPASCNGAAP